MIRRVASLFGLGGAAGPSSAFGVIPDGLRVVAVGDIHGRLDLLKQLLTKIYKEKQNFKGNFQLIFLGDVIDRGPDSAGVVELLKDIPNEFNPLFLRGNHEQAMLDFLHDPARTMWLSWGGIEALASYNIQPFGARGLREPEVLAAEFRHELVERGHMDFYTNTILRHVVGGYAFVHAGVRSGISIEKQMDNDLLFIRDDFIGRPHGLPYRVVFGHTIMPDVLIEHDRIACDTGAYDTGVLSAVVLEGSSVKVLQARI